MNDRVRCLAPILAILMCGSLSGCGVFGDEGTVIVRGTLNENNQPFRLDNIPLPRGATALPPGSENGVVRIDFIPVDGIEQYPATLNLADGSFEVRGLNGKGIKPGGYRVAITASFTPEGKLKTDYFDGRFSRDRTPIYREVKAGAKIEIDVGRAQG
jgi:hypothetical protein